MAASAHCTRHFTFFPISIQTTINLNFLLLNHKLDCTDPYQQNSRPVNELWSHMYAVDWKILKAGDYVEGFVCVWHVSGLDPLRFMDYIGNSISGSEATTNVAWTKYTYV